MKLLLDRENSFAYLCFAGVLIADLVFAAACAEPTEVENPAAESGAPEADLDREPGLAGVGNADQGAEASRSAHSSMEDPAAPAAEFELGEFNIILVTVDTERADATQIFGQSQPTTPFLAELAEQGITFENAFSPAPWTAPAMYSIITGLYPSEHGIRRGVASPPNGAAEIIGQEILPDEAVTLAERLREDGFATFGVSTNLYMSSRFGFDQGFDEFVGGDFASIPYPNLAVDSMAERVRGAKRWFFWLHYFDPHFPYIPVSPWFDSWNRGRFNSYMELVQDYVLRGYREKEKKGPDDPVETRHLDFIYRLFRQSMTNLEPLLMSLPGREDPMVSETVEFLRSAYLSEVRRTDDAMRAAFQALGVDERTLIIATADHGEEFLDHGGVGHREFGSVYQELIHVPLVICLPGRAGAGTRIKDPVSTLDIVPTLLELLGRESPAGLSGQSLVPLLKSRRAQPRSIYSETEEFRKETLALVEFPWKLIYNFRKKTSLLYNLSSDPWEQKNLADTEARRAQGMLDRLLKWRSGARPRWPVEVSAPLSQEEIHQLKNLGYLK